MKAVLIGCALLALLNLATSAQSETLEWIRQFGTELQDSASSVSADRLGSVFVASDTLGDLGGPSLGQQDGVISKFNAAGELAWSRQFGSAATDYLSGISTDGRGNVYISGTTHGDLAGPNAGGQDAFLVKYDSGGTLLWSRQLGSNDFDYCGDVFADAAGNAYLVGRTDGSLNGPNAGLGDAFISKFDSAGTLLWARQYGTSGHDGFFEITGDELGNVYVSGNASSPTNGLSDALVGKYDADGALEWIHQFGSDGRDYGTGIALDGLGSIFVSGATDGSLAGPNAGSNDALLSKYDTNGSHVWTRQNGTSSQDYFTDVSTDGFGNVYVSGVTAGVLGEAQAGQNDAFVGKYDANGDVVWIRQLGTPLHESTSGIATNGTGNVYIAGSTGGSLGGENTGDSDFWFALIRDSDATGDTNGDGLVDLEDLNNVRNHFGGAGLGDTNADGMVDLEDLNNVRNHFGETAGAAAVPEPAGLALASIALLGIIVMVSRAKRPNRDACIPIASRR